MCRLLRTAAPPRSMASIDGLRRQPSVCLAAGALAVFVGDYAHYRFHALGWFFLELVGAAVALIGVFAGRVRLRLPVVLAIGVGLHLAMVLAHLHLLVAEESEWSHVFARQGDSLIRGNYPDSEYPVGAVLLFGLEALLGARHSHAPHALLMIPFQALLVLSIWSLRTTWSRWMAACVAIWPTTTYFWYYKFDLAPAALLAAGIALAMRRRFAWAGVLLAAGTLIKWSPSLALVALAVSLAGLRTGRAAFRMAVSFVSVVLGVYLPFIVWDRGSVLAAYTKQGSRAINGESVWYLPLRLFGLETQGAANPYGLAGAAGAPKWADALAISIQVLAVLIVLTLAYRAPSLRAAAAMAALLPTIFLLSNRIFSAQFFCVCLASWAVAAALIIDRPRDMILAAAVIASSSLANVFVYPYPIPHPHFWLIASALRYSVAIPLTSWLLVKAYRAQRELPTPPGSDRRLSRSHGDTANVPG